MIPERDYTGQILGYVAREINLANAGPEPLSCAACSRRIGEYARHWVTAEDYRVICYACGSGGTMKNCTATLNHLVVFPGCGVAGHDIHDHPTILSYSAEATRRWLSGSPGRVQFTGTLGIMLNRAGTR